MGAFRSPFDAPAGPAPARSPRRPGLLFVHRRALAEAFGSDAPAAAPGTGQPAMRRTGRIAHMSRVLGAEGVQVF